MNDTAKEKLKASGPLTRDDIADVLLSIAPPGEKRDAKRRMIKELCEARRTGRSGDHFVWDTLDDFPQY